MNTNDSQGLARALFEEAGDALLLFEPQTDRLLDVNHMAEALSGFPRDELLGFPATYLFRFGGKGGMQRLRQACHETVVFHSQEGFFLRTRHDGVWIPVNLTVTRLHVRPQTLALITARDVRERHEAQARLQQAEGELRRVLASVSDCLWSASLNGAGHWEYSYLSPVVEKLTGRPLNFFHAGPDRWADVVHPEDRQRWRQAEMRLRAGKPSLEEYRILRPDGTVRWVRASVLVNRDPAGGRPPRLDGVLTDVTERRQAEERFRLILDAAHEAFVGMDAAGAIIDWNQQAEATFGWTRSEAVGRPLAETIIPPQHRDAHKRGLKHFLVTGEGPLLHKRIEVTALHREGREFPVELTITPVRWGTTHIFGAFVHDISERKRAEETLARERNLLRALMDHLPDHIFVKDPRSRFVTANAATVRTLGAVSLDEVLGKTDFDFLPQDRAQQFYADEQTVLRTGEPLLNREEFLIDAAGRRKWLLTTKAPFRDGAGAVVGLVGMSHDVTERREAEEERAALLAREQEARAEAEAAVRARDESLQALRASEEQYRSLAEAIPQIVWTARPDGAVDYYNRRWFEYTGTTLEQTRGWGWAPVIHPDDLQKVIDRWTEAVRSGEPFDIECRFRRAEDAAYRWHLSRAVPVRDQAGRVVKWFGACTDIDDQRRAAEALHNAKEAAEAANRAKSEFLANMSHEIRTPMNGIIGMTDLALETNLTREQREYLTTVKASADSLLAVINDILDFSRIEARKLQLEFVDFHLRDNLGDMLKSLAMRAEEKGLELACHIHPDVPDVLVGDPTRLRQVIVNLVGNALKFTEQGEVIVQCGVHSAESRAAQSGLCELHFAVTDTGVGVPADKQKLIFEAFSQADASTTRKYGGTGLGLAICTQLVHMMGGRIWVESEVGKGSTFHFTARFGLAKGPVARPPAARPEHLQGLAVLVVDDNGTNRRILEELLRSWGLRPLTADGGPAALGELARASAAGEPFPLVLLDAHMPAMDGFTLAGLIRQGPEQPRTALVMLTSAAHTDDVARCRELGIDAYLMKPVKQSELLDAVLTALGRTAHYSEPPAAAPVPPTAAQMGEARRPLRVLLAEDNPVNQKLAVRLLEKRGHTVEIAGDGRQALAALARQAFDLVLMDVQMPDVDGYDAARHIRWEEQRTGRRIPILAMTAYAMKGDRERCLEAGMDGYVSKPVQPHELFKAIDDLVPPGDAAPPAPAAPVPVDVLDMAQALNRVGGDRGLLNELAAMFLNDCPAQQAELRAAVERGDGPVVQRLAHTIKGAVGTFGAQGASEAARALETMARQGDMSQATAATAALDRELARLRTALAAWTD
jgi:PAS domain S-box-containing protein